MATVITDLSNNVLYTFPSEFDIHDLEDRDFKGRTKILERFGRHGGNQVGDRGIKNRKVVLKGAFHAANQAALQTLMDNLGEALHNDGDDYRFSWETGRYIGVSHAELNAKRYRTALAYKSVKLNIDFICPDPFWYSTTDDSVGPTSITGSPQNITFANNGKVPSPLTIQCDPTATWADFTIKNATDDDNLCRYKDPALGNGDQLIIDGQEGTVERDSLNTVRYFKGAFLRVLPGNNTITYTGTTGGTITLTAPKRYL